MRQERGSSSRRSGEHGPQAGAPFAVQGGRPDPDGDEVPVAREPSADGSWTSEAAVSSSGRLRSNGASVGVEGDGVAAVELHAQGLGEEGLDGVAGACVAKHAGPDGEGDPDGAEAPRGHPERGGAADDQRGCGVDERHDQSRRWPAGTATAIASATRSCSISAGSTATRESLDPHGFLTLRK